MIEHQIAREEADSHLTERTIASHSVIVGNISQVQNGQVTREKFKFVIDYVIKYVIP